MKRPSIIAATIVTTVLAIAEHSLAEDKDSSLEVKSAKLIEGIEKLAARAEIGITYKDYVEKLGDLNFEFKRWKGGLTKADEESKAVVYLTSAFNAFTGLKEDWEKMANIPGSTKVIESLIKARANEATLHASDAKRIFNPRK